MRLILLHSVFYIVCSLFFSVGTLAQSVYTVPSETQFIEQGYGDFALLAPGDTLYLESGKRSSLTLMNVQGTALEPIVLIGNQTTFSQINGTALELTNCAHLFILSHKLEGIKFQAIQGTAIRAKNGSHHLKLDQLDFNGVRGTAIHIATRPNCFDFQPPQFALEGITITNSSFVQCDTGIIIGSAHPEIQAICNGQLVSLPTSEVASPRILNNRFEQILNQGILIYNAQSGLVINNTFTQVGSANGAAAFALDAQRAFNGIIAGNEFNYSNGLRVDSRGQSAIYHNVIKKTISSPGIFTTTTVTAGRCSVFNNLISETNGSSLELYGVTENKDPTVMVANNIMMQPGTYSMFENLSMEMRAYMDNHDVEIQNLNNFFAQSVEDQHFENYPSGDFNLNPQSSLVDQGYRIEELRTITKDRNGDPRVRGNFVDIGPEESAFFSAIDDRVLQQKLAIDFMQPVTQSMLMLQLYSAHNITTHLFLVDLYGRKHPLKENFSLYRGNSTLNVDIAHLANGYYTIILTGKENLLIAQPLMISR